MEENQYLKRSFIERLQCYMQKRGINDNQMTVNAGLSIGLIGKAKGSNKGMSASNIEKILLAYPDLNSDWLLTGRGDMLRSNTQTISEPTVSNNPAIGIPYYDVDFIGGFSEIINSQTSLPATNIVIRGFEKADLWCNVTGHSMEPRINHGDIIALRKCTIEDIQYGEIYAVVLDTIRTIKILRKAADPQNLRFIPINTQDYDEQEFSKSRILNIFEVIGSISKFF